MSKQSNFKQFSLVLFDEDKFCLTHIYRFLSSATTPGQGGTGSNGYEGSVIKASVIINFFFAQLINEFYQHNYFVFTQLFK